MEFRIVSIRELPSEQFSSALELELEDVQPSNSIVDGYYKPVARITAYVPNFGEFRDLTIGARLNFGPAVNRVPEYSDCLRGKKFQNNSIIDKLPDVMYEPEPLVNAPAPKSGYFNYDLGESKTRIIDNFPPIDGRSTRAGCTGLPPSGLASEAIEPNEREAERAVAACSWKFQDNFTRAVSRDPQERAREEMKKAFPIIVRLLRNKEFVESVVEKGYKPNLAGILQAYLEASDE